MKLARVTVLAALAVVAARVPAAHAYDPATTHAGLTERAALASELHRVLARALSRPLGLFEPIALSLDQLPTAQSQTLRRGWRRSIRRAGASRRPGRRRAGAGLGRSPDRSSRRRRPSAARTSSTTRAAAPGFRRRAASRRWETRCGLLLDAGGGFRAFFTGTQFNMTGRPSTRWLRAPENDVGLEAFHADLEAAVAGEIAAGAGHRARPRAAGAGRRADRPRGRRRAGPRSQRLPRAPFWPRRARAPSIAARRSSASSPRPTDAWACPRP